MPVPGYQELMFPLLKLLSEGEPLKARHAHDDLAVRLKLTEDERTQLLPSGGQSLFENRVGWAKTYLKKAGLVDSPKRGIWQITERGVQLVASGVTSISKTDLQQFNEFRAFTGQATTLIDDDDAEGVAEAAGLAQTPTDAMELAYQRIRDELAADLLALIKTNTPAFFEQLVVDLMINLGYGGSRSEAGKATQLSADGGIDGVIREDRLGLDTIYLQAKRWENTVGRPDVQKFAGALQGERARKGVMITTSGFSDQARKYVDRLESKIVLINGIELAHLMIDHDVGVATKQRYDVKVIDGDYFE